MEDVSSGKEDAKAAEQAATLNGSGRAASKGTNNNEADSKERQREGKDDGGLLVLDISKEIVKIEGEAEDSCESSSAEESKLTNDTGDGSADDIKSENVQIKVEKMDETGGTLSSLESKVDSMDTDMDMPPKQTLGKGKRARIPNKRYSDILLSPSNRSFSNRSFENGAELMPEEPVVKKVKTTGVDITHPKLKEPFKLGWKRELVYRADPIKKNLGDGEIYYYTPTGKKLKSCREILETIKNTSLTIENFTFLKEPIGMDPDYEIIRDAHQPSKLLRKSSNSKSKHPSKGGGQSPKVGASAIYQKISSPKLSKSGVSDALTDSKRNLGNFKIKAPVAKPKSDKNKLKESPVFEDVREIASHLSNKSHSSSAKKASSNRWPNSATESSSTNKPSVQDPCSIRCSGVSGLIPTLQCRICLCLYHHECVGYDSNNPEPYVCKNCHLEDQTAAAANDVPIASPINSPPPLIPVSALKPNNHNPPSTLPKLHRINPLGGVEESPSTDNLDSSTPQDVEMLDQSLEAPLEAANPPTSESKSLLGAVTTWLPHNSKIVDSIQRNSEVAAAPRPQYLEIMNGRKFLVIPKHNLMLVTPSVAATATDRRRSSSTSQHPQILPESPSKPENSRTDNEEATTALPPTEQQQEPKTDAAGASGDIDEQRNSPRQPPHVGLTFPVHTPTQKEVANFMTNYLQNVSYGYSTLLYIFQYLKVQDLLRAGCVCTMWRDIANHPSLWRTVRMKNSQVHSFEGLANALKKHGTIHLDLRKMLLPSGGDDIWPQFSEAIKRVDTLRKIELCRCPAEVVEKLAISNPQLEVVNAVTIKCEKMSLESFSNLKELRELRIKSTQGLTLTKDIDDLIELKSLTHLSLTSIKDLNKLKLTVLAELTALESLDLGECTDFPAEFGQEVLLKLTNLEKLRFEKGQGSCQTCEILEAIKKMEKLEQLELVNFDIKAGFDKALGECGNLRKLLIIPTYISQSATTNHMVLGGVLRLQKTLTHFVWGVTLELLRVTELFIDQCEEKKNGKKKNGDSIPVLKPVPALTGSNTEISPALDPPQVEILALPSLQKHLLQSLPHTRVKILKIPFHATWRQSITDAVN